MINLDDLPAEVEQVPVDSSPDGTIIQLCKDRKHISYVVTPTGGHSYEVKNNDLSAAYKRLGELLAGRDL